MITSQIGIGVKLQRLVSHKLSGTECNNDGCLCVKGTQLQRDVLLAQTLYRLKLEAFQNLTKAHREFALKWSTASREPYMQGKEVASIYRSTEPKGKVLHIKGIFLLTHGVLSSNTTSDPNLGG